MHTLPPKERLALQKKHTGFVFQSYHLLDDLTVYENIELPLAYRKFRRKNEKRSSVMRSTDLTSWANGIYFLLNFLAANSNWSAWYERRLPNLNYFWRTNQPAICIPIRPRKLWICFAS